MGDLSEWSEHGRGSRRVKLLGWTAALVFGLTIEGGIVWVIWPELWP